MVSRSSSDFQNPEDPKNFQILQNLWHSRNPHDFGKDQGDQALPKRARIWLTSKDVEAQEPCCEARLPFDQFCGLAGSSVVYQSTRILLFAVLLGAIGKVLVRSRASSCSNTKRSSVKFWVSARLSVQDKASSPRSTLAKKSHAGTGPLIRLLTFLSATSLLVEEPCCAGDFSLLSFRMVTCCAGSSKRAFSSGYFRISLRVTQRRFCPTGASLISFDMIVGKCSLQSLLNGTAHQRNERMDRVKPQK